MWRQFPKLGAQKAQQIRTNCLFFFLIFMLHFVHFKLQICFTNDRYPSYTSIITTKSTIYSAQWQHLLMNWFISVLYTSFKRAILKLSKSINIVWFDCSLYDIFFHVEKSIKLTKIKSTFADNFAACHYLLVELYVEHTRITKPQWNREICAYQLWGSRRGLVRSVLAY